VFRPGRPGLAAGSPVRPRRLLGGSRAYRRLAIGRGQSGPHDAKATAHHGPGGRIGPIDRHIGHLQHFRGPELAAAIERHGLKVQRLRHWGFPFHSLYKCAINRVAPQAVYAAFGEQEYGLGKRVVAGLLNASFYVNDLFGRGTQVLVLARRPEGSAP